MRSKIVALVALLCGVFGGLMLKSASTPAHAQEVAPPNYEFRTVLLNVYTPDELAAIANQYGQSGFHVAGVVPASPYGSAILIFERAVR